MTEFNNLNSDLTHLILSYLPLHSLIRASAVCKLWHSIISSISFSTSIKTQTFNHPWLFIHGIRNTSSKNNQSFAYDPFSNLWFRLPALPAHEIGASFVGSDGYIFTTSPHFSYTPVLKRTWISTSPVKFSRVNPLLGVFQSGSSGLFRFILVGGVGFIGGLVDIEDRLAVEIYDPHLDLWEISSPLPADLIRSGISCHSLSSALFGNRFFVFGIYTSFFSFFDLTTRVWSQVQTLRPPGVFFSFLMACKNFLVLAGICNISPLGLPISFNLWKIDDQTMEFSEIAIMPQDLLYSVISVEDRHDDDNNVTSLKCVGMGNLVYVYNEECHRDFPACVCELSDEPGKFTWRKVPKLPFPVNKFHKVVSFCSPVSLP